MTKKVSQSKSIVVGVGASAGGLEALQEFFKNVPLDSNLSYVVIQHLSPDYKSLMDELLARCTKLPIQIAKDNMEIIPNYIYLIPPRKNLQLFHDKLYLESQDSKFSLHLPVDFFFNSLAKEKGKDAIGVILSGTGSDGTLGTRAIKEAGGIIIVQDEKTAKFDGMPKNAIATGLVDLILSPDKMPDAIVSYVKHPLIIKDNIVDSIQDTNLDTLTKIVIILRDHSGIDFSFYKETTILRRLERRVSINRFDNLEDYLRFLASSNKEKDILNKELLIGVTRFFRDKEAFESINNKVIPQIGENKTIRIWSAGCSTGEEVYSLAILLNEYLEQNNIYSDIKIFATDIDKQSIEFASKGLYPESVMADVDNTLLSKYFTVNQNSYQIIDKIRRMIVFAKHNILKDSPFSKLDLIVCRNMFIYFKAEIQQKLLSMMYYSLNPTGFLFLGNSETIGDLVEAFKCIDSKWKIFQQKVGYKPPQIRDLNLIPHNSHRHEKLYTPNNKQFEVTKFERLFDKILSTVMPPSILLDHNDNIIHGFSDTSRFTKLQPGRFSQNIHNNVSSELSVFLTALLRKLKNRNQTSSIEYQISLKGFENKVKVVGQCVEFNHNDYFLISFSETQAEASNETLDFKQAEIKHGNEERIYELEKELQFTKENLQATVEELETSNEELQSSNEELIASNEELQSTNEELQSVNEELYTVNSEYQLKIEELTSLNNDINNLLNNIEVGALYLDRSLSIRKITPMISKITNILPGDIGRPLSHLKLMNIDNTLIQDVLNVVDTLQPVDKEFTTETNITYLIRIRPYRTDYNAVEGILVTFIDITKLKNEFNRANIFSERLKNALEIANMEWWEWDIKKDEVVFDTNSSLIKKFNLYRLPSSMKDILNLIHKEDLESIKNSIDEFVKGKTKELTCIYRMLDKDGNYEWFYNQAKATKRNKNKKHVYAAGMFLNISRLKELEQQVEQHKDTLIRVLENSPIAKTMVDKNGNITYANKKAVELFNLQKDDIYNRTYHSPAWKITGLNNQEISPEQLPFAQIRRTLKPVLNYQHYIELPNGEKILLNMSGTPIFDVNNNFEGAVFALGVENDK